MLFCAIQNSEYDRWYADSGGAEKLGGADLSENQVGTVRGVENCTIPIVEKAKYLGSILDSFGLDFEGFSKKSDEMLCGRTTKNAMVVFPKEKFKPGQYVNVTIESCTPGTLIGKVNS